MRITILCIGIVLLSHAAFAGDVPAWMRQAASVTTRSYEKDVPAVVLHDEQLLTLGNDGKLVTVENHAVKMLNGEGRNYAVARVFYLVSAGKVREIEGWLIRPDGSTKNYDKKTILDVISDPDDVYNEGRLKIIDASREVEAGYVFGYTAVFEDTPLFNQDTWSFQGRLPTVVSRYALNLPVGWTASSVTFNASEIKPQVTGSSYVWEMRDLAPIPPEPMSPDVSNLAPRIAVNYAPANSAQNTNRTFADWIDVSRWATSLNEPEVIVDANVTAKAKELTANAKTELEIIQAIGSFVQNLQYISIDIGVGHGNGYRPRSSSLVLSRGYGDCKDKANLMRAMLKVFNIEAYPVLVFSGDPAFVREQWPSPRQFNHCIIGVKVSDATTGATIVNHAKLGRLLIFDATDSYTRVGDLPDYLQDSLALVVGGNNGGLFKMPVTPAETDLLERKIEANLSGVGQMTGIIRERANGQASTAFRREYRSMSTSDFRKAIESWLSRGASGSKLENVEAKDAATASSFDLDVKFSSPTYGQLMQEKLLIFKPVIVGRRHSAYLTENKRINPIEIDASAMNETAVFTLPEGFGVDEMPDAFDLDTAFGKYSTRYEIVAGKLVFSRKLKMIRTILPVEKYAAVKDFFSKIREAEQSTVVLVKK